MNCNGCRSYWRCGASKGGGFTRKNAGNISPDFSMKIGIEADFTSENDGYDNFLHENSGFHRHLSFKKYGFNQ